MPDPDRQVALCWRMPLAPPWPDLGALHLLVSVGETGSISAAAVVHGVSQPAASMRLRTLERVLGLQLLERSHSGARLTAAGAATVEWAAAVLDAARALQVGVAALRRDERSQLRIAASLTVAEYLLPGWLQRLGAEEPSVAVSLEMGNTAHVVGLVLGGGVDAGFIEGRRPEGRLRGRDLHADELLVVVGRSHPWARRRRPIEPAQLSATALLLREPGSGTRDVLTDALGDLGLAVRSSMELGSTTAIKAAAIAGSGPAVLSRLAVAAEVRSGVLVVVPCAGLHLTRTIRAVWASGRTLPRPAARLVAIAASDAVASAGAGT